MGFGVGGMGQVFGFLVVAAVVEGKSGEAELGAGVVGNVGENGLVSEAGFGDVADGCEGLGVEDLCARHAGEDTKSFAVIEEGLGLDKAYLEDEPTEEGGVVWVAKGWGGQDDAVSVVASFDEEIVGGDQAGPRVEVGLHDGGGSALDVESTLGDDLKAGHFAGRFFGAKLGVEKMGLQRGAKARALLFFQILKTDAYADAVLIRTVAQVVGGWFPAFRCGHANSEGPVDVDPHDGAKGPQGGAGYPEQQTQQNHRKHRPILQPKTSARS